MANLSKIKRDQMLAFLEELKSKNNDDDSIRAINEIENQVRSKKYGLVWEEHSEQVDELLKENIPVLIADEERRLCKDPRLPWNFIIEGDNLQALYLLEKTHKGRVDCIYIDPPYNSGAHDWKYNNKYVGENDSYKHSKWLSMMKSRLNIAKKLLNPDNSTLICTIDEKEYLHLGNLLEEMFPLANIQMISSVINRAGTGRKYEFSRTDEYIFYVRIGKSKISFERADGNETPVTWDTLRRSGPTNTRNKTKNQFYPVFVNLNTNKIESIGDPVPLDFNIVKTKTPKNCVAVYPIRDNGLEMMWGCVKEEFIRRLTNGYIRVGDYTPNKPQKYVISYLTSGIIKDIDDGKAYIKSINDDGSVNAFYHENKEIPPTTNWNKPSHDAQWYGSKILKKFFSDNRFPYPKSLYAVMDCLYYCLKDNPNAIVLDFFAGSGTTFHALNLLNYIDSGKRKCILVTNNEVSEEEENELTDKGYKKGDNEWEELGIARYVTWPRTYCAINGVDINNNPLKGNYGVEQEVYEKDEDNRNLYKKVKTQLYPELSNLKLSDGFDTNVKYLKCDWTPRKPEEYLLSNALLLHIKELIELHTAKEIDGVRNIILYSKSDYDKYFNNEKKCNLIENVWVNENILFNSSEMKKLKKKKYKYIPREFFSQELKEVGEYV